MYQIINTISPFIAGLIILYISCSWVLIFFKRDTLVKKYFTENWDIRVGSVLYCLILLCMFVLQLLIDKKFGILNPLSFILVSSIFFFSGTYILFLLIKLLSKYRNNITPQ